jgi:hypothetical protein
MNDVVIEANLVESDDVDVESQKKLTERIKNNPEEYCRRLISLYQYRSRAKQAYHNLQKTYEAQLKIMRHVNIIDHYDSQLRNFKMSVRGEMTDKEVLNYLAQSVNDLSKSQMTPIYLGILIGILITVICLGVT